MRFDKRSDLCSRYAGSLITDQSFRAEADALDWSGVWPVIDSEMRLVGIIVDSAEDQYFNYRDEAMISLSDVMDGGWRINVPNDGYASPPMGGGR